MSAFHRREACNLRYTLLTSLVICSPVPVPESFHLSEPGRSTSQCSSGWNIVKEVVSLLACASVLHHVAYCNTLVSQRCPNTSCALAAQITCSYEGIFTPVFRGSPWDVSKPHNYVLFEWDTYLSAMIAIHTDPW